MGRDFAAPRQADIKGWQQAREQWRARKRHEIETKPWSREKVALPKKLQAQRQRQFARAAWLKKSRRKRYLKNLEKWAREQS